MIRQLISKYHNTYFGQMSKLMAFGGAFTGQLPLLHDIIIGQEFNFKDCIKLSAMFSVMGYFWFITYPVMYSPVLIRSPEYRKHFM